MAITTADLRQNYSQTAIFDFDRDTVVTRLFDRTFEADLRNSYQVSIPKPDLNVSVGTYTRHSTTAANRGWGTSNRPDFDSITLQADQNFRVANEIDWDDENELPIRLFNRFRAEQTRKIGQHIEDNLVTFLGAQTFSAADDTATSITFGTAGTGSSGAWIAADGETLGADRDASRKLVHDAIRKVRSSMAIKNVLGPHSLSPEGGRLTRGVWMIMRPELFDIESDYLESLGLNYDRLSESLLVNGSIFGNAQYIGSLKGVALWTTTALPIAGTVSNSYWDCYASIPGAAALAVKTGVVQTLTPETNPDDATWAIRQKGAFGRVMVDPQYLFRLRIRAS